MFIKSCKQNLLLSLMFCSKVWTPTNLNQTYHESPISLYLHLYYAFRSSHRYYLWQWDEIQRRSLNWLLQVIQNKIITLYYSSEFQQQESYRRIHLSLLENIRFLKFQNSNAVLSRLRLSLLGYNSSIHSVTKHYPED